MATSDEGMSNSQQMMVDNSDVRDESNGPALTNSSIGSNNILQASDISSGVSIHAEPIKQKIIDLAYSAMDELFKIGIAGEPLWQTQKGNYLETLDEIEYLRQFGQIDEKLKDDIVNFAEVGEPQSLLPSAESSKPNPSTSNVTMSPTLQVESSRDMAYINMSPIKLIELLMDMNQFPGMFFNIVSRATMLGTLLDGVEGSNNGKLQVMSAELHLPTPFVPARDCYFARYCKLLPYNIWGVVDVSLEKVFPSASSNYRRRPSGCLIMEMSNGISKVVWVEHVEADHSKVNEQFQPLVTTGFAFSATRWISSLVGDDEWCETLKRPTFVTFDGDRMMRSFCADISASARNPWRQIRSVHGSIDMSFIVKNNTIDLGKPTGTTVVFATSLRLNASPNQLFNFLRHESSRRKWDLLSRHLSVEEFAFMTDGKNIKNRVSLIRTFISEDKTETYYLQKSYTDSTAFYVIYAPLDEAAFEHLANGSNPDVVMILPSGFVILPAELPGDDDGGNGAGSILTIAFHIIENNAVTEFIHPQSVEIIKNIIKGTVSSIRDAVLYNNHFNNWMDE
ncbi:hypothetical protein RIF29_11404 [Crotalaria pallida]|uniref:START domain-containing protein n=1 Tax=Crotalaria pallida TaxID=3830 RepID=A0AAN9IM36_CROPI